MASYNKEAKSGLENFSDMMTDLQNSQEIMGFISNLRENLDRLYFSKTKELEAIEKNDLENIAYFQSEIRNILENELISKTKEITLLIKPIKQSHLMIY